MLQFILLVHLHFVECTIDINLSELEYLSNHLTEVQCDTLFQLLHTSSFEVPTRISSDIFFPETRSCLEKLVHWNSSPDEGLGETHNFLSHRLRQVGRRDLANWLSKSVFTHLSEELNDTILSDPFKKTKELPTAKAVTGDVSDLNVYHGEPDWDVYDTVTAVIALILALIIIMLIFGSLTMKKPKTTKKSKKTKKIKRKILRFRRRRKYNLIKSHDMEDENGNKAYIYNPKPESYRDNQISSVK